MTCPMIPPIGCGGGERLHTVNGRGACPPTPPEDVPDPIRATWETWVAMAADLDTLADRIATR
jgi:hypothetical protein